MHDLEKFIAEDLESLSVFKIIKLPECKTCREKNFRSIYEEHIRTFLKTSELLCLFKLMEYVQKQVTCNLDLCDYDEEMSKAIINLRKGNIKDIATLVRPLGEIMTEEESDIQEAC